MSFIILSGPRTYEQPSFIILQNVRTSYSTIKEKPPMKKTLVKTQSSPKTSPPPQSPANSSRPSSAAGYQSSSVTSTPEKVRKILKYLFENNCEIKNKSKVSFQNK